MFIIKYYLTAAMLCLVLAYFSAYFLVSILLIWIGLSLAAVSAAYILKAPGIFRKKQDGTIPSYMRWLFIPFLAGVQLYNLWARKNDQVPAIQQIEGNLFLACRLFPSDMAELHSKGIKALVDVTAEFDGLDWTAHSEDLAYLNVPVLDHQSPKEQSLMHAVHWIANQQRAGKSVVVHCALGRGRSVLVVAAYLLCLYPELTVEQALQRINDIRQTAALNRSQLKALIKLHKKGSLRLRQPAWLIANPVSGGAKWQSYKDEIEQRFTSHFQLKIVETTKETGASELAQQAIAQGATTIIACGGDGTLSAVAAELIGTDLTLGIIPLGTANALAHVLFGLKSKIIPVHTACDHIIAAKVQKIDTASCNGHLVLLVVGLGFEQKMIATADREQKDQGGQLAYVRALWDAVNQNEPQTFHITIDEQAEQTIEACSLIVANAAPFLTVLAQGGGEPNYQDGMLDITWLPPRDDPNEHIYTMSELVMSGLIKNFQPESVEYTKAKKIRITGDKMMDYVIDGENFSDQELVISINPASLNVLFQP
ncbi:diacylglycerol kinase family protein [Paraglaciecola sp.]|uniref:diacylglycerol kinase family protein n=1 Tax=Paraglaciecola sp. TaxID=1920173 RepID=UPI0030F44840